MSSDSAAWCRHHGFDNLIAPKRHNTSDQVDAGVIALRGEHQFHLHDYFLVFGIHLRHLAHWSAALGLAAEGRFLRISDMASRTLGGCRRRTHTCTWHAQQKTRWVDATTRVEAATSRCPVYSDGRPFGNLTARRKRGGPSVDWPSEGYLGRNTRSRFCRNQILTCTVSSLVT